MLIYFTSRVISSTVAFLYPGYASYKTLSQRPASEEEIERWLMYWSVLGCIVGVEYVAEWLISWLPLYYPMKTIFLLYLSLPQTRGSSFLYLHYLQPFLQQHESEIDATLVRLKNKVYSFVQEKLRMLWDSVLSSLGRPQTQPGASAVAGSAQPPSMGDPVSGPSQLLAGLWQSYGPGILGQGAALFTLANAAAAAQQRPPPATQGEGRSASQTLHQRNLSDSDMEAPIADIPTQRGSSSYLPSSKRSSDASLRARGGQFEEVEVPSDVEGYDVGGPSGVSRPTPASRASWFGWSAPAPAEKGSKDN